MHHAKTSVCIVQKLVDMHRAKQPGMHCAETSRHASCKNKWACIVQKQAPRLENVYEGGPKRVLGGMRLGTSATKILQYPQHTHLYHRFILTENNRVWRHRQLN